MRTLLLGLLVGCSAATHTHDEIVRAGETSDASRLGLPPAFSKLGASCGAELTTGSSFVCGHDHRIASLTIPFHPLPRGGTVRYRKMNPNEPPTMSSASVEIDGPRVWMEIGCRYCRMMASSTTVVDLRLIDDEGLAQVQGQAGLPRSPLLRTTVAWNDAMSGWESMPFN
jgi:hypothetical protein